MGQQQLLLIVLGVIVVGIAIVVGINLFNANAVSANKDAVVSDLNNLASLAISYYKKPTSMGGGGQSFKPTGSEWSIPSDLDSTANGTYDETVTDQSVTIVGTGTEKEDGNTVKFTCVVGPTGVTSMTETTGS